VPRPGQPGRRRFEVPWGPGGGAAPLADALARHLAELGDIANHHGRQVLIISIEAEANAFTQALVDPVKGMLIEAVSNEFLHPDHTLDEEQMLRLDEIGYGRPEDESFPNHYTAFERPVPWNEAAAVLVRPLTEVYGVGPLDTVAVESFPA